MKLSINSSLPNLLTKEPLKSIYCKLFSKEDGKISIKGSAQMG
ncbi:MULTISPECIES: hypothetical protein [unclassified Candidatus Tisiphia]